MTLSEALRKPATTFAISGGIFVLVMLLTLFFEGLSATGRLVVAATAIGGALVLKADQRSFFQFRLSGSTVMMVIGFAGIAAGMGLGTFLFLGLALLSASLGLVSAFVQFVRFRSLQFILETAANVLVVKFVFFVGAQI